MKPVKLFDLNMGQMPDTLPLLPLMEMVLMPEGKFSIRLTDYKQIAMIYWALANGRMVAIVQQKTDKTLYLKGCAARICGFSENDDDSLMVYLTGVCRFNVIQETQLDNFKVLKVDYNSFAFDMKPADEHSKQDLLYALNIYLKTKHIDIDVALLENLSMRKLIATLASILPFEAGEKQALLECGDVHNCIQTLKTILKMDTLIGNDEKRGLKC